MSHSKKIIEEENLFYEWFQTNKYEIHLDMPSFKSPRELILVFYRFGRLLVEHPTLSPVLKPKDTFKDYINSQEELNAKKKLYSNYREELPGSWTDEQIYQIYILFLRYLNSK